MAHFAEIDSTGRVIRVLVVNNDCIVGEAGAETEQLGIDLLRQLYGETTQWVQTSYNNNFRNVFAGPGFVYDSVRDAFLPPAPYPSWVLNESTLTWEAPVPCPDNEISMLWNEESLEWQYPYYEINGIFYVYNHETGESEEVDLTQLSPP